MHRVTEFQPVQLLQGREVMQLFARQDRELVRLTKRYDLIIEPYRQLFRGKRILDLGAHDGRWSLAMAQCGAREVIGVEARINSIENGRKVLADYSELNIEIRLAGLNEEIGRLASQEYSFDIIAIFGLFYHTLDHYWILKMCKLLGARHIIIDSEFANRPGPCIVLVEEDNTKACNAAPILGEISTSVVGIPSRRALERMATSLGYSCKWSTAFLQYSANRTGIQDYFREGRKTRSVCCLTTTT